VCSSTRCRSVNVGLQLRRRPTRATVSGNISQLAGNWPVRGNGYKCSTFQYTLPAGSDGRLSKQGVGRQGAQLAQLINLPGIKRPLPTDDRRTLQGIKTRWPRPQFWQSAQSGSRSQGTSEFGFVTGTVSAETVRPRSHANKSGDTPRSPVRNARPHLMSPSRSPDPPSACPGSRRPSK
jgi:hypothetical protein